MANREHDHTAIAETIMSATVRFANPLLCHNVGSYGQLLCS